MSDAIQTDRDFFTNGIKIPAGRVTTEDLKQLLPVGEGDKKRPMNEDEVKSMQQELLRRQARYQTYSKGITESHSVTKDAGTFAVGSGAE